jgi:exonuclease SbcC
MALLMRELEVEGFRLFRSPLNLKFSEGLTVISGPVGSGKSSLLSAVEYALYGTDININRKLYSKRDLVNDSSSVARVALTVEVEGVGAYRFERIITRNGKEKASATLPDGKIIHDEETISNVVEELTGLDFFEFSRSIAVNHVLLFLLAYGGKRTRSIVIDRLLGIDSVERIARSIVLRPFVEKIEELGSQIESLGGLLSGGDIEAAAMDESSRIEKEIKDLLSEKEKLENDREVIKPYVEQYLQVEQQVKGAEGALKVLEEQLKKGVLSLEEIIEALLCLQEKFLEIAEKLQPPAHILKKIENLAVTEGSLESVFMDFESAYSELISVYYEKYEELKEQEASLRGLHLKLKSIDDSLIKIEKDVNDYEKAESIIEELSSKYGDEKEIMQKIQELSTELERLQRMSQIERYTFALKKIVAEGVTKVGEAECPVCGSKVTPEFLDKARMDVAQVSKKLRELEESMRQIEGKIKELKAVLDDLRTYKLTVISLQEKYDAYQSLLQQKQEIEEELEAEGTEFQKARASLEGIETELKQVRNELSRLRKEYSKLPIVNQVNEIRANLSRLQANLSELKPYWEKHREIEEKLKELENKINEKKQRLQVLKEKSEEKKKIMDKLEELHLAREKIERVHENLSKIKSVLIVVHSELRERKIMELNAVMNKLVKAMYPYSDVEEVRVRILPPSKTRKYSIYEVEAKTTGTWLPFTSRMSDGQKTIIFLALTLGLSMLTNKKVGFVILDEPLPNVDDRVKVSFLKSILPSLGLRQAIITTQAEDVAGKLEGVSLIRLSR